MRVKEGKTAYPKRYGSPKLVEGPIYTINRVWYDGDWYLTIQELSDFSELKAQYLAVQFEPEPKGEKATNT